MVIKLTNVSKVIKKAKVLDNINLELTSGKVYGFKGKNGSGKTMLMRVICGLISATEGTVEIDGRILGKDMTFTGNEAETRNCCSVYGESGYYYT